MDAIQELNTILNSFYRKQNNMDTIKNLAYNTRLDDKLIKEHFGYLTELGYLEHINNGFYKLTLHGKVFVQQGGFVKQKLNKSALPRYRQLSVLTGIINMLLLLYLLLKRK